jgi:hypothetical protein
VQNRDKFGHQVEGAGFGQQVIEHVEVVLFAFADVDERRDGAARIQHRMKLDDGLGAEWGPRKYRQAQVDGVAVECVDDLLQLDIEKFVDVKDLHGSDQSLGELGVYAAISHLVGIDQCAARDTSANAHVIELRDMGTQAPFDIAQTFSESQLCEGHAQGYQRPDRTDRLD